MSLVSVTPTAVPDLTWLNGESLTWGDARWDQHAPTNFIVETSNEISLVDARQSEITAGRGEHLTLVDSYEKEAQLSVFSTFDISEEFGRACEFSRVYNENSVILREFQGDDLTWINSFATNDYWGEQTWIHQVSPWNPITVFENVQKQIETSKQEDATIADSIVKNFDASYFKTVNFSDLYRQEAVFNREYSENFGFADKNAKEITKGLSNKINLFEQMTFPVRGVISDLLWENGSWTESTLKEYATDYARHVGFRPFRDFVTGEYSYDKALFRVAVDSKTADRALIEYADITIDVPDIFDRGTVRVDDAHRTTGVLVKFNRRFTIEPEVVVSMQSGSSNNYVIPVVQDVTTENFRVFLYDSSNQLATGIFTWNATGY